MGEICDFQLHCNRKTIAYADLEMIEDMERKAVGAGKLKTEHDPRQKLYTRRSPFLS